MPLRSEVNNHPAVFRLALLEQQNLSPDDNYLVFVFCKK